MAQPFQLDDQYRIDCDARQWVLQRLRDERDEDEDDGRPARPEHLKGQALYKDVGYYSTVEMACQVYAQRYARESDQPLPTALADATKRLNAALAKIKAATGGL